MDRRGKTAPRAQTRAADGGGDASQPALPRLGHRGWLKAASLLECAPNRPPAGGSTRDNDRMTSTGEYSCPDCGYQYTIEHGRDVSAERPSCPECGAVGRSTRVKLTDAATPHAVADVADMKADPDNA